MDKIQLTLEAEALSVQEGYVVKSVKIAQIIPGMILAKNIKDVAGKLLIAKGSEITDILKERLKNFARIGSIVEPIKVLDKVTKKISE